ncbi:MAG TPA: putative DNA binding domain-containing protein, partial [bacterium]|nr:putative DNA binding domain-containing protein [bacterium]
MSRGEVMGEEIKRLIDSGENERVEFKESWRDEFLKHICAFANTEGGVLLVGVKDNGIIAGISNSSRLLEDIPNKVIQALGIIVTVGVHNIELKNIIEIKVPVSSVPISFRGRFYVRSGSTVQELHGHELRDFILRKDNVTWDSIAVSEASVEEIDINVVRYFATKAVTEKRLYSEALSEDISTTLKKLDLINEAGKLTKAAILLFGKRPGKYIRTAIVKIGRFGATPADLISHDIIEG